MSEITWKDATSYGQGQRGNIEPTAWECRIEGVRIWVSCGHIYYPGVWLMNSEELGFDKKKIAQVGEMPVSSVQARAIQMCGEEAKRRARRLIKMAQICEANHE